MKTHGTMIALAVLSSAALAPRAALADDSIKVGLLATLEGPFTVLGQDSVRGAELALQRGQLHGRRQEDRRHQRLVRRFS